MSKISSVALAATLLIGFAGVAGAQTTGTQQRAKTHTRIEGRRGSGREYGGSLAKDLNLTEAQKAQVKTIHEKYKPQLEAVRSQFKPEVDNARALRAKGDTAGARAAFKKSGEEVRERMLTIREQEQAEIREILTPEQRTKFDAAQEQRKKGMEEKAKTGSARGKYHRAT
jgi:Spy/CpxP family protein refolding chaperone